MTITERLRKVLFQVIKSDKGSDHYLELRMRLVACVEALEVFNNKYSPGDDWNPLLRNVLADLTYEIENLERGG